MVKKLSEEEFAKEDKSGLAVVDFSATWCGPCKMLGPVVEELSNDYEGKIKFYNIDVDDNPDIAEEYGITNIPALVILKDGQKQDIQVGFQPKANLSAVLDNYL